MLDEQRRAAGGLPGQPHDARQTPGSIADESLRAGQQAARQSGLMQSALQGLGAIDHGSNKVVDLNTLMSAFENYITEVSDIKSVGIPISFFFRKISRGHIARLWLDKYFAMTKAKEEPDAGRGPLSK